MSETYDIEALKRRMAGAIGAFRNELAGLRTGRASTAMLDPVMVEAYGTPTPVNQVATVNVPEPRMLSVQVWDKGLVGAVDKAIRAAGLGVNPQVDGTLIRLPIPELNEERRRELVKLAHKYAEQTRIAVRNVRRDGMDALKKAEKDGDISQDEHRARADDVQKLTDGFVKEADDLLAQKEREIMQV